MKSKKILVLQNILLSCRCRDSKKTKNFQILLLAGVFLLDFIPAAIVSGTSIPTWTASALPQASILKKFRLFEQKETEKTTANDARRNPVERQKEELDRGMRKKDCF